MNPPANVSAGPIDMSNMYEWEGVILGPVTMRPLELLTVC